MIQRTAKQLASIMELARLTSQDRETCEHALMIHGWDLTRALDYLRSKVVRS